MAFPTVAGRMFRRPDCVETAFAGMPRGARREQLPRGVGFWGWAGILLGSPVAPSRFGCLFGPRASAWRLRFGTWERAVFRQFFVFGGKARLPHRRRRGGLTLSSWLPPRKSSRPWFPGRVEPLQLDHRSPQPHQDEAADDRRRAGADQRVADPELVDRNAETDHG